MKTFLLTICFLSVQTGMVAIAQDKEQTPVYLDDTQPIEVKGTGCVEPYDCGGENSS